MGDNKNNIKKIDRRKTLVSPQDTLSIILGGGKGTRLFPLTKDRCKPAVPLGGKYRLIDVPISNCINSGLNQIYIVSQFMSASLNQHVARAYRMDVFSRGFVSILTATQTLDKHDDWFQGTADAVRKCIAMANIHRYKRVIILSGDQLYKMDYARMLQTHEDSNAKITIGVLPVEREKVDGFGIMQINDDGVITRFAEKPSDGELIESFKISDDFAQAQGVADTGRDWLASMGIYIFETDVLLDILRDEKKIDFGKDIIPSALNEHRTQAHLFDGYWEDIGTIKSFFTANIALGQENPQFDFYESEDKRIFTHQRFLTASRFLGSTVSESVISDGCNIGRNSSISRSVVGIRSRIGEGSIIEEACIMGADYYERPTGEANLPPIGIGRNVTVKRSILDKNVTIGDGAQIINAKGVEEEDGENYHIRDGIVIIPKNAIIKPNTII